MFSSAGNLAIGFLASLARSQQALQQLSAAQKAQTQLVIQSSRAVANSFLSVADAATSSSKVAQGASGAFNLLVNAVGLLLLPIISELGVAFLRLAEYFRDLAKGDKGVGGKILDIGKEAAASLISGIIKGIAAADKGVKPGEAGFVHEGIRRWMGLDPKAGGAGADEADRQKMLQMIRDAMSFSLGMKGQVGFSSIADAWKQVQMKSFMSPFERLEIEILRDAVRKLDEQLGVMRQNNRGGPGNVKKVGQMGLKEFAENFGGAM